jgi:hypothetical protein
MPTFVRAATLALCAGAFAVPRLPGQQPETGALVTVLGNDTVAVERWTRTGGRIDAEAAVRSPRTVLRRFTLELSPSGALRSWDDATLDAANPGARPLRTETIRRTGDGWRRTVMAGDSIDSTALVGLDSLMLPWVDLVHWPFELATRRVVARGGSEQTFVAGGRPLRYAVARDGERVTLTHPLRGPSVARVDARGRLLSLDAAGTTRKVVVTRVASVDVRGAALRWAAADRAGRGLGELSGRGADTTEVAGARIVLDYGTPSARGRRIWGGIVPWGQVWRTGANRATHIRTSRPLVLGTGADTVAVPAGEYTLFSVPAETGGLLIVNRQTNQAGTSYDAARDLGRVPLTRRALAEPVERLTLRVTPEGGAGGLLRIQWADAEMVVPFRVR